MKQNKCARPISKSHPDVSVTVTHHVRGSGVGCVVLTITKYLTQKTLQKKLEHAEKGTDGS